MKSNKFNKKNIMKICKILFLVLVAIFLAKYFYTSWDDIKKSTGANSTGAYLFCQYSYTLLTKLH